MKLDRMTKLWLRFLKIKVSKNVFIFNTLMASVCMLLFVFGIYTAFSIKTEYSLKQFYPKSHPLLAQEDRLRSLFQFNKDLSIFLVLKNPSASSWLEEKNFFVLKQIHTSFQESADFKSVVSLASIRGASSNSKEISVGLIFDNPNLETRKKIASEHPFVKPHLLVTDETSTLLILNLKAATPLEIFDYTQNLKTYFSKN